MAIRSLTRRAARTGGGGRAMSPTPAPMRRGSSARPPLEASGPTGMKAVVNGGLNLSVLDGWWAEAYDGTNGWALPGDVQFDRATQDKRDVGTLDRLLAEQVVPTFYDRSGRAPTLLARAHPRLDAHAALGLLRAHARRLHRADLRADQSPYLRRVQARAQLHSRERSARRARLFSRSFSQVCTSRTLTRPRPTG